MHLGNLHGEDRLLAWLRRQLSNDFLGDDAAILPPASWAVTMDAQIAGVHFPAELDPSWVAHRLIAVNLSDLAAMGAVPAYAFLSLSAPPAFDHRRFFRGFRRAAAGFGLELAGGDLARHSRLTATLTVLGRESEKGRWLRRSGARAGDDLWLGGTVGEAALGLALLARGARLDGRSIRLPTQLALSPTQERTARRAVRRQLRPVPQLDLGSWLARNTERGAAIDVSDGLSRDLHRMCRESGVGAVIEENLLPLPRQGVPLARALDRELRELALFGGEDYVLLFSLASGTAPPAAFGCRRIGTVRRRRTVEIEVDGHRRPLPNQGWDHIDPEGHGGH